MDIPIEKIVTQDNVRQGFNKEAIRGLAQSISNVGLLQPVIVKENSDETFTLLVGHRRFEAARLAEVKAIRAIIFDDSESKLMLQLIENLQRENLNPIEEALAYKKILEEEGLTQEELAAKLGKPQPNIANTLRLLKLPPDVQKMLMCGDIKQGHGKVLLQIKDPDKQQMWAERTFQGRLSVSALREAVLQEIRTDSEAKQKEYNQLINGIREFRKNTESSFLLKYISPEEKLNIRNEIAELIKLLD
ncbi:ParB/RepB/Spo0J family partition protein [Pelotomaculum propionicicum]|uniref:ParB/RepB/Spo0J family partition protein n=1 Tax=Pelotomaculum propionicicum TaxID=258475 RepID=UPI003B7C902B